MITKCAVTVLAGLALTACHRPAADTSKVGAPPPARTVVREGDLNTILLTPDAESRLGIETKPVELHDAARMHVLPAVVMLPPDARTTLTAPFTGRVQFSKQTPPKPGSTSEAATLLATIIPVARMRKS